jgi:hypothetical protein
MTNFVLVPGACHGGWWYQPLVERLVERDHTAHALTLAGLGDGDPTGPVNLSSHIAEATAAVCDAGDTGLAVEPMPFFDARARPHPVATLLQRIRLTGAWRSVPVKHYVAAEWPGRSPFADTVERVRSAPGWTVHEWPTPHNVLRDGPERVLDLLADL